MLYDLDRDGVEEIVATSSDPTFNERGSLHVYRQNGTAMPGFPKRLANRPLQGTPAVGDITGDGVAEIIVASYADFATDTTLQHVYAYTVAGTLVAGFPVALGRGGAFTNSRLPSPTLLDLTGDGDLEIIALGLGFDTDTSRRVVAIEGNGQIVFSRDIPRSVPAPTFEYFFTTVPMVGNIVGDRRPEIVVGLYRSFDQSSGAYVRFFALDSSGNIIPGWPVQVGPPNANGDAGVMADLDADGFDEIIFVQHRNTLNGLLHAVRGNGQELAGFPVTLPGAGGFTRSVFVPVVADVDSNGMPDIAITGSDQQTSYLAIYNGIGAQLRYTEFPGVPQNSPAVAGLDASGFRYFFFPWTSTGGVTDEFIHCIRSDGAVPAGYPVSVPVPCPDPACSIPSQLAMVRQSELSAPGAVVMSGGGHVYAVELGVPSFDRTGGWPQFQYDPTHSGAYRSKGSDTVGVFVPSSSAWFLRNANSNGSADLAFGFGPVGSGWKILRGDWDGDHVDTPGLYNPANGFFFLSNTSASGGADWVFGFGPGGSQFMPVVGDFDADGVDTIGIYDVTSGVFFLKNTNTAGPADVVVGYGAGGSNIVPLLGDYDGSGSDTVGIYDSGSGFFFLRNSNTPGPADLVFGYGPGGPGIVPVIGDFNGDGTDTVGIYSSSNGFYFLRNSNGPGGADIVFGYGPAAATPLVGDWDGQ